jgi:hypothetical protein
MGPKWAWAVVRPTVFVVVPPLCVWIWLCAERPWTLGFYSDDWFVLLHPKVGSLEAFADILVLVQTRPVSAPFIWAAQALADWSPVRAQIICVLGLALVAAAVGFLAHRISQRLGLSRDASMCAGSVAATTFICFPSTLGTFAWSVGMLTVAPPIALFCFGMSLLIGPNRERVSTSIQGMVLLLSSHLAYEAFYFQEIVVLAISLALSDQRLLTRRQALIVGVLITINLAALAFNRLAPGLIHKQFNPDWWHIFIGGYLRIGDIFAHATREAPSLVKISLIAAIALGCASLAYLIGVWRAVAVAGFFVAGGAIGGALYAMAGYGLSVEGVMARTANVISVYCALFLGLLSAAAFAQIGHRRWLAVAQLSGTATVLVGFSATSHARLQEWAATWTAEVERLAHLPQSYTFNTRDSHIYVVQESKAPTRVIPTAAAPWEINGAIAWELYIRSGFTDRSMMAESWHSVGQDTRWYTAVPGWFNRWDGSRFEQGFCANGVTLYYNTGTELRIWRRDDPNLAPVEKNWSFGCGG